MAVLDRNLEDAKIPTAGYPLYVPGQNMVANIQAKSAFTQFSQAVHRGGMGAFSCLAALMHVALAITISPANELQVQTATGTWETTMQTFANDGRYIVCTQAIYEFFQILVCHFLGVPCTNAHLALFLRMLMTANEVFVDNVLSMDEYNMSVSGVMYAKFNRCSGLHTKPTMEAIMLDMYDTLKNSFFSYLQHRLVDSINANIVGLGNLVTDFAVLSMAQAERGNDLTQTNMDLTLRLQTQIDAECFHTVHRLASSTLVDGRIPFQYMRGAFGAEPPEAPVPERAQIANAAEFADPLLLAREAQMRSDVFSRGDFTENTDASYNGLAELGEGGFGQPGAGVVMTNGRRSVDPNTIVHEDHESPAARGEPNKRRAVQGSDMIDSDRLPADAVAVDSADASGQLTAVPPSGGKNRGESRRQRAAAEAAGAAGAAEP